MDEGRTIAALASPPGAGMRGIVRVSGPGAFELLARTFQPVQGSLERGQRALLSGRFADGRGTQPALCLWMPAPRSYTGEDVFELHLCGSPPLLEAALTQLVALGARPARRGEFTRRAFLSGRLDLSRAEGVLALIEASDLAEGRAAAALLLGGLERRTEALRAGLEDLRALVEASLDFDESDTGHVPDEELRARGLELRAALLEAGADEQRRARDAGAPRVVLAGRPNAGKSALFNALVGPDSALESELAGTTRDVLEAPWTVAGVELRLFDTAGIAPLDARAERGDPARQAQELASAARGSADLVLLLVDAAAADAQAAAQTARAEAGEPPRILVWSQCDRAALVPEVPELARAPGAPLDQVATSARARTGLVELERAVARALGLGAGSAAERAESPATAGWGAAREVGARHRAALLEGLGELDRALALRAAGAPLDLFAEALRGATDALDAIGGRTAPEDLLERIFARFCIGK